jgi:hypothetical protein
MKALTQLIAALVAVMICSQALAQDSDKILVTNGFVLTFQKPIVIANTSNEADYVTAVVSKGFRYINKKVSFKNNLLTSVIEKVDSVKAQLTIKESYTCTASADVSARTKLVAGDSSQYRYRVINKSRSTYTLSKEGDSRNYFYIECKIQTQVVDINNLKVTPNKPDLRKQQAARLKAMYNRNNPLNIYNTSIDSLIHANIVSPVILPAAQMRTKNIGFESSDIEIIDETEMTDDEIRLENEYQKSLSI